MIAKIILNVYLYFRYQCSLSKNGNIHHILCENRISLTPPWTSKMERPRHHRVSCFQTCNCNRGRRDWEKKPIFDYFFLFSHFNFLKFPVFPIFPANCRSSAEAWLPHHSEMTSLLTAQVFV